jgi:hypothetical protein
MNEAPRRSGTDRPTADARLFADQGEFHVGGSGTDRPTTMFGCLRIGDKLRPRRIDCKLAPIGIRYTGRRCVARRFLDA